MVDRGIMSNDGVGRAFSSLVILPLSCACVIGIGQCVGVGARSLALVATIASGGNDYRDLRLL
jgi:hypothetical protein